MDTKAIAAVIVVLVVAGGGYWYATQGVTQPVVQEENAAAGATMPVGSDMPDNGMVGGDAVPTAVDTYTLTQVAEHATAASCWSAVNGSVYDLTKWIPLHPGGEAKIKAMCGKDASAAFTGKHGGQERPEATLASYKIGELAK